ncbi:hypothetical protein ACFY6U_50505 [Streptomyces sp. NPDC013157]|uniref:hypothetical protein n=1 Tax=Streptomyces sp. NPDC013157 TaxID=3364861 RepID=UPI0036B7F45E
MMNNELRQAAARVGAEALSLTKVAAVLFVAGITADLAYSPMRHSLSAHDSRIGAAVLAVIFAVGVYQFLDWTTSPIRKRLTDLSFGWPSRTSTGDQAPAAATLDDGIALVADAAVLDAAARAAHGVMVTLDDSGSSLLSHADRWQGFENGEARYHLAPGLALYFRGIEGHYGKSGNEFTLLSGDSEDDSLQITSLAQLHQHLTARAAGLPVAVPVDDSDGNTWDLSAA